MVEHSARDYKPISIFKINAGITICTPAREARIRVYYSNHILQIQNSRAGGKVIGDGAYDSGEVYDLLEARGIELVIKPRSNAKLDAGSLARGRAVSQIRELGYDASSAYGGPIP